MSQLCWGKFLLYTIYWGFLSRIDTEFCQMLFLYLLRWSCNFYPSVCYCAYHSEFIGSMLSPSKSQGHFYGSRKNNSKINQFSSVQFSRSVVSNSLRPHELQHTKPPCPSPTSRAHSNSHPTSQWCHPAISSSVIPFSSCPQSLPASESFPMSQLFPWGGQVLEFQL